MNAFFTLAVGIGVLFLVEFLVLWDLEKRSIDEDLEEEEIENEDQQ